MARGRGAFRSFECLTCGAQFRRLVFWWSDPDDPRNEMPQNTCPNASCAQPHIRLRPPQNSSTVQVRAEQRAVVYTFPDGSWAQPGTNDPNDPVAQTAIRDGGFRREFPHVRDLRTFQREMRKTADDEMSGYSQVSDYDEASLQQRDTETPELAAMHHRERRMREAFGHTEGMLGGRQYERAYAEAKRRGWVK